MNAENQPNNKTPAPAASAARSFDSQKPTTQAYQKRKRRSTQSEYSKSLTEKQTLKRWYGLSEKQFKRYVTETLDKMGKVEDVSAELIRRLEKRLDNVVFRMGIAKTRAMARQMVSHGFFSVNGRRVDIASYEVAKGDVIALKDNKKKKLIFKDLPEELKKKDIPAWLSVDKTALNAKPTGEPTLEEVKPPAEISQIFEFYSR